VTETVAEGRLSRTFSALRYRDFRLLWFGAITSTIGTFMQTLAQAWLVYTLTGSAFLLGVDGPAWLDERGIAGRFVALDGEIVESSLWRGALACT